MKRESRRESDEIPNDFLSKPQALMHWSLSMWSLTLSASISDVLHVYASSPDLLTCFSSTQRFPADDTANAHVSWLRFSHSILPAFHPSLCILVLDIYENFYLYIKNRQYIYIPETKVLGVKRKKW